MTERNIERINAGVEAATEAEPFLLSKAELLSHIQAHNSTGCGGYSTIEQHDGKRVVGWDYACKD
jgi:hypothetical protein